MTPIDRARIATLIPHAGTMCLLDCVLRWDANSVRCLSRCHVRDDNPLRRPNGILGMACGVEIAAQAMAVHGRLVADHAAPTTNGYLASLRDVHLRRARLDDVADDLVVDAERLMGDAHSAVYRFTLGGGGIELLSGRATVLLGAVPE
ncbi:MAG: hydroxymyristoyl-ACP dehydratase [Alphaproteobacteria bacterium]|nr:hydroxymyristoyl-ACP dehydratase [Alphaproteobacteria bacterium]